MLTVGEGQQLAIPVQLGLTRINNCYAVCVPVVICNRL